MKIVQVTRDEGARYSSSGASGAERVVFCLQVLLIVASGLATLKGIADFFGITEHGILSPNSYVALALAALIVAILTWIMWFSIEWAATPSHPPFSRVVFFALYLVLLIWSVGFGYGFWWSALASKNETEKAVSAWVTDLNQNIADADGQLTALIVEMRRIRTEAVRLRNVEQTSGGTCGRNDGGGCKALCATRTRITEGVERITTTMETDWLKELKSDLGVFGNKVRDQIEELSAKPEHEQRRGLIDIREHGNAEQTRFNSFSKQRAAALSGELGGLASSLNIRPAAPGFTCFNAEQAASIQRVVDALKAPPALKISEFSIYLGNDATRVAILKLWRFVASGVTGRELSFMRPTGIEPSDTSAVLRGDDWIALMATVLVDISILIFAWFKPRPAFPSQQAAKRWLEQNLAGRENDFMSWYSEYQFDRRGLLCIVRPTEFWGRSGKPRDSELSVDRIMMVAVPLVGKKLIKEIRPSQQLLTRAQQVLINKAWAVQTENAPATIYRVVGSGMAQLYSAARGEPVRPKHSIFRSFAPSQSTSDSGDRRPGQ